MTRLCCILNSMVVDVLATLGTDLVISVLYELDQVINSNTLETVEVSLVLNIYSLILVNTRPFKCH